jgi:hypothetical protein
MERVTGMLYDGVKLENMEKLTADGGKYNTIEIHPVQSSCRFKLPPMIANQAAPGMIYDIYINKPGDMIAIVPGDDKSGDKGHEVSTAKGGGLNISSPVLAEALKEKSILLPVKYKAERDDRINGWVCRKIKAE